MSTLSRDQVRTMMGEVLAAQGKELQVEDELDTELNFDAPGLRAIETVGDVLDFIDELQKAE